MCVLLMCVSFVAFRAVVCAVISGHHATATDDPTNKRKTRNGAFCIVIAGLFNCRCLFFLTHFFGLLILTRFTDTTRPDAATAATEAAARITAVTAATVLGRRKQNTALSAPRCL